MSSITNHKPVIFDRNREPGPTPPGDFVRTQFTIAPKNQADLNFLDSIRFVGNNKGLIRYFELQKHPSNEIYLSVKCDKKESEIFLSLLEFYDIEEDSDFETKTFQFKELNAQRVCTVLKYTQDFRQDQIEKIENFFKAIPSLKTSFFV